MAVFYKKSYWNSEFKEAANSRLKSQECAARFFNLFVRRMAVCVKDSNTTLVIIQRWCWFSTYHIDGYSNTTLVTVQLILLCFRCSRLCNSNTTLVNVQRFVTSTHIYPPPKFKYNPC